MAVTAYPLNYGTGVEYSARQGRQVMAALMMPGPAPLRTRSGLRPGGAPTVTANATTWSVGPFSGVVDTGQSSITGPYLTASDGTETGAVTAAHASFPRKDILYVQVDDTDESDGTGQRRGRVLYLAGTASSTPAAPATPARSLRLGIIDVPASGGGAPAWTADRTYTVAAGGIVPVADAAERNGLATYDGMVVARLDTGALERRQSGSWRDVRDGPTPGKASATANQTGVGATEVVSLTVNNMLFRAGRAYRASIRCMVYGTAGNQAHFRLRKTNTSGADWGEFGRTRTEGFNQSDAVMANGSIILLRSAGTDLTAHVALTAVCSTSGGTISVFGSATSPRYLLIEDCGPAADYAGLGVDVT